MARGVTDYVTLEVCPQLGKLLLVVVEGCLHVAGRVVLHPIVEVLGRLLRIDGVADAVRF